VAPRKLCCCIEPFDTSLLATTHISCRRDLSESLVKEPEQSSATGESKNVTGIVTNQDYGSGTDEEAPAAAAEVTESTSDGSDGAAKQASVTWKLNLVLYVISCFYAMSLTGWGSIQSGGNAANPSAGSVSMWMIIASQWLVMALYIWTLVAPRLFPDRDFS